MCCSYSLGTVLSGTLSTQTCPHQNRPGFQYNYFENLHREGEIKKALVYGGDQNQVRSTGHVVGWKGLSAFLSDTKAKKSPSK